MMAVAVIFWIFCATVTAGVAIYFDPDVKDDSCELAMLTIFCLVFWWLLASIVIGKFILCQIAKFPIFIAGIIDGFTKNRGKKE